MFSQDSGNDFHIIMTPYPIEPGHTLISVNKVHSSDYKPEQKANASHIAEGDNAGIVINKPASIMDYNRITSQSQRENKARQPSAKMSFKVFLINSETNKISPEHRTLRFWISQENSVFDESSATKKTAMKPIITDLNELNLDDDEQSSDEKNNGPTNGTPNSSHLSVMSDNQQTFSSKKKNQTTPDLNRSFNQFKSECSHIAQSYFCQLIGTKPDDDFPKNYVPFIMKVMRLLKRPEFRKIYRMEIELRQLTFEDKPPSRASSNDSGRGSPLTSQKILDIVESSYPNSISLQEICTSTNSSEDVVRQFIKDLTIKEKINTNDNQHFTRVTTTVDSKVNLVKQMPRVTKSEQPTIAIITAQFYEKLAVDAMISEKQTFVKYRTTAGGGGDGSEPANYVYTLGDIGDHRVVSTKLTSVGHSQAALIASGNATTRLLGTFPEIEYVFLVGCAGGIPNYTNFEAHVRLGDVVISSPSGNFSDEDFDNDTSSQASASTATRIQNANTSAVCTKTNDFVYVHCKPKQSESKRKTTTTSSTIPSTFSIHSNLKSTKSLTSNNAEDKSTTTTEVKKDEVNVSQVSANDSTMNASVLKPIEFEDCQFRMWTPMQLELQEAARKLWLEGLENPKHRIWEYYIEEGIKCLKQQHDVDASRPPDDSDKLFMSLGEKDAIEVSHPEPSQEEVDLRKDGRPMCHFGPVGSGNPAAQNEAIKQQMVAEFGLRAFDADFDPVIESIHGNRKENYIMIRGISDYKEGKKRREWQQYSALVAAAYMKSLIVKLKPIG